jgi:hypothetical protein
LKYFTRTVIILVQLMQRLEAVGLETSQVSALGDELTANPDEAALLCNEFG